MSAHNCENATASVAGAYTPPEALTAAERPPAKGFHAQRAFEQHLLEPSAADGGHLIGRDPRTISRDDWAASELPRHSALKAIRLRCLDCCAGAHSEVRKCIAVTCPSWPLRMGTYPANHRDVFRQSEYDAVSNLHDVDHV